MSTELRSDRATYREAMSRLGAAVNIITTTGPEGDSGFTASAVCSVTDDPPTLLVCMNRNSSQNLMFKATGILCVNVLTREEDRFARSRWERLATGAPALSSAAASFDCAIDQITEVGTHSVFFCGVRAIRLGAARSGLIYHGRAYHVVGEAAL
jgi:flavin reductase